ncbi:hypothetical protein O181_055572 [Austropuccinia psidii MF-1]|uniref:Uncharacterized protein n=1 Tax=Austropuccinia psidii MF-1 TaxID=1389203 RepID=A0A9Q3E940_9BASI|nr:hypothetical protein [Austropuccinia psidii MF-1]
MEVSSPCIHVSLLEPVKQSSIPNRDQFLPPPVLVEEQEEWEVAQVLDSKLNRGLGTTSTSSPSSSSLPSSSGSGGELEIHLILFTMPSVLVLEIGTFELEYMGLPPPTGLGPPTLVHLATSLCLEPVTESRYKYPFKQENQFTYKQDTLKCHQELEPQKLGTLFQKPHISYSINTS